VAAGACIDVFNAPARAGICIAFAPHGRLIACGVFSDIYLWDISASGAPRVGAILKGHTLDVRRLAFSPDGRYLASCSIDDSVRLWHVETGECLYVFDEHIHSFWSMTFSPDGALLAGGGRSGIHI